MTALALSPRLPGVEWTPTGLQVTEDLSYERFEEIAAACGQAGDAARWYLGDLFVWAETRYGEEAAQAYQAARVTERTLRRYIQTAAQIPAGRRRPNLSFSHHAEVAGQPPEIRDSLLERAEKHEWTVGELRERIQDAKRLDRIAPARQDVLDAGPIVAAVAGLGQIREALGATYQRLRNPDATDALDAAETVGPALRALDEAEATVTAAAKVVTLRDLCTEILAYARSGQPGFWEVPEHLVGRLRELLEGAE